MGGFVGWGRVVSGFPAHAGRCFPLVGVVSGCVGVVG